MTKHDLFVYSATEEISRYIPGSSIAMHVQNNRVAICKGLVPITRRV